MMQGLDESFDAAIFIGYHSRAGSADALLDHTYSSSTVYSLKVNGMEVGESELNAIIAAQFGVPVVMISGDKTLCNQVRSLLDKNIVTVVVKEGIGRNAANTLVPAEAQKVIREGASTALKKVKDIKPFRVAGPYKFEIDFLNSYQAEAAELIPGIERTGPRTVSYSNSNFLDGFRLFRAILVLAAN
jgi:D-amino peptidase